MQAIGLPWMVGSEGLDGYQWQAKIADFFQDPVQSSLVGYRAGDERFVVAQRGDGKTFKPVFPLHIEMTFDLYLVNQWLPLFWWRCFLV